MSGLSLQELNLLNQEILAIVKARAPMAQQLALVAQDLTRQPSSTARHVAKALERGQSLEQALEDEAPDIPPFYTAIVAAGMRSGRLTMALEQLTAALLRMEVARRQAFLAIAYPLVVFSLAWVMLVGAAHYLSPTWDWIELPQTPWLSYLRTQGIWSWVLAGVVPGLLLLLLLVDRLALRRTKASGSTGSWWMDHLPGVGRACQLSEQANFAALLSLLLDHHTPLPDALRLAGQAVAWPAVTKPAEDLAHRIETGQADLSTCPAMGKLPPLVRVSLLSAAAPEGTARTMRHAAIEYHRRAADALANLSHSLPAILTAGIGGTAVAVYALLVLSPYYQTLWKLAF